MRATRAAIVTTVAALVALSALSGCAPAPAPEGVTAEVYQPRTDIALERIAIQVRNDGAAPVTITRAELDSELLAEPLVWKRDDGAVVGTGRALDLRIPLGGWACPGDPDAPLRVALDYTEDGRSGTLELRASELGSVLHLLHDAGCLAQRVDAIAPLRAAALETDGVAGVPGTLVIAVEPTGAAGEVRVERVRSTTLLNPARDGIGVNGLTLGAALGATGPTELRVPIVANRCDPHALAEDKVGTRIPLEVTVDGVEGRYILPADDAMRDAMHRFYVTYCDL